MVAWGAIGSAIGKVGAGIGKVGAKVGGFLAKNAGTIGNVAGGLLGGLNLGSSGGTDVGASKALMDYQFGLQKDYTQWLNENQWQQMRTGLENAGYNPLMALGATPASGAIGMGSAVSGNTAQFSGLDAVSALSGLANISNVQADTEQKLLGTVAHLFGTKLGKKAQNLADSIIGSIENTAKRLKATDNVGDLVLQGYVSNTANDKNSRFHYEPQLDEYGTLPPELSRYK